MSHRLSNRKTGQVIEMGAQTEALIAAGAESDAAMFYVKRDGADVPWHKLGKSVEGLLTSAEALKASGCDYDVQLGELYTPDMKLIDKKIGQRVYRTDNDATLGIVGARYNVISNQTGFEILDSIIGDDSAKFDTAGALGVGEMVFATVRLPEDIKIAGDIITPYFHILLTHDGSASVKVYAAPTRQVCQNTVNFAISEAEKSKRMFSIRHTRNYEARLAEAAKVLGVIRTYAETFEQYARKLLKKKFGSEAFDKMLNDLIPLPEKQDSKAWTLADRERSKVWDCYNAEDLNNVRDTAWGAINAIADYSDHMRPQRGDDNTRLVNEFLRSFTANGSALKDKALELIVATK